MVFLGFSLNTKEWKIRVGSNQEIDQEIDVESMPNRPLCEADSRVGSGGLVPNKPLTSPILKIFEKGFGPETTLVYRFPVLKSGAMLRKENQPKEEGFGTDIPQIDLGAANCNSSLNKYDALKTPKPWH